MGFEPMTQALKVPCAGQLRYEELPYFFQRTLCKDSKNILNFQI